MAGHRTLLSTPISVRARVVALGRHHLSWRRARKIVAGIVSDFAEHDLLTYSSAMAFQVLYAVVPLCFLTLAGLGLFGGESVYVDHVAPTLHDRLSTDAYSLVNRTALTVLGGHGRVFWLTAGLGVTIWGVGAAVRSTMTPLNAIYGARETRSWLNRLLLSLGVAVLVIVCIFSSLALVFGGRLIHPSGWALGVAFFLARWIATAVLLLLAIASVIRFVPDKKRPVAWVSVGSCLATLCWVVATLGYATYISSVSYSSVYGAFASVVLLLIYVHIAAIALLLGVVADAQLRELVGSSR